MFQHAGEKKKKLPLKWVILHRERKQTLPEDFDKDNARRKKQNWIDGDGTRLVEKKFKVEEEHPDKY